MKFGETNPAAETRGGILRHLLILALTATLFFTFYQHHRFRGLTDAVAMDHAQLGRALSEGRGYRTRLLRPIAFGAMNQHRPGKPIEGDLPELGHPPLYPAVLAAAFRALRPDFEVQPHARAFAPETRVILPLGWFFTLATAMLIWIAGNRLFDRRIAAMAAPAYLLSQTALHRTISGLPDAMAGFLVAAAFTLALTMAHRDPARNVSPWRAGAIGITTGILCGLAVLSRYYLILFAPAPLIAGIMGAPRRRGLVTALFTLALLTTVTPWLIRNHQVIGHPFGLAHLAWLRDSAAFPGDRLDRALAFSPDALRIGTLLRLRWIEGLSQAGWLARWCGSGEILFPALALAALAMPNMPREFRSARLPLLVVAAGLLLVEPGLAPLAPGSLLYPLLPWMMLLGCAALIGLLDRMAIALPIIRQAVCAAALLMHATPLIAELAGPRATVPYPPLYPPFVAAAGALVEDDQLMVSDLPWACAWYANQRTLWLPNSLQDFYAVNDYHQTIAALYLTRATTGRAYVGDLIDGASADWLPFVEGRLPRGFPLTEGLRLPAGRRDQIVLIAPGLFAEELLSE